MTKRIVYLSLLTLVSALLAFVPSQSAPKRAQTPALPYSPSLDVNSMDKSVSPCVDFYHYACGNWQKMNPIPADQTSWSVYAKLFEDNLNFLHGILEEAASNTGHRDAITQQVGDFYAACMDEAGAEKRGLSAIQPQLDAIANLKSTQGMAALVAWLQFDYGETILFSGGSGQDLDNSEQVIAQLDQGGLGLPDRDYYTKDDAKSKETRERYVQHLQKTFALMGDNAETASRNAGTVMRLETALAKAALTRVERRDPYKLKHKMTVAELNQLASNFDWKVYFREAGYPGFVTINVGAPDFFKEVNARLAAGG